jgi:hypothetical protein
LETETPVIVTAARPGFVTVTVCGGLEVPTLWFPKLKLAGETDNAPGVGVAVGVAVVVEVAVAVAVEVAVAVAVLVAVAVAVAVGVAVAVAV